MIQLANIDFEALHNPTNAKLYAEYLQYKTKQANLKAIMEKEYIGLECKGEKDNSYFQKRAEKSLDYYTNLLEKSEEKLQEGKDKIEEKMNKTIKRLEEDIKEAKEKAEKDIIKLEDSLKKEKIINKEGVTAANNIISEEQQKLAKRNKISNNPILRKAQFDIERFQNLIDNLPLPRVGDTIEDIVGIKYPSDIFKAINKCFCGKGCAKVPEKEGSSYMIDKCIYNEGITSRKNIRDAERDKINKDKEEEERRIDAAEIFETTRRLKQEADHKRQDEMDERQRNGLPRHLDEGKPINWGKEESSTSLEEQIDDTNLEQELKEAKERQEANLKKPGSFYSNCLPAPDKPMTKPKREVKRAIGQNIQLYPIPPLEG